MIPIDLSKQQALDADSKTIEEIDFTKKYTGNLAGNTAMFSIIEEAKEIVSDFSQETVRVLKFCFTLI